MAESLVQKFADAEAVSRAAAEEVARRAREAVSARGRFTIALAGGSTPRRLYELLAGPPFREQIDWSKMEIFWGDERSVPPDHKDSNFRMARLAMLDMVPAPASNVHRIHAEQPDRYAAARDYQAEIARVLGVAVTGEPPAFDLVLLGMGPDAHTASLFPGTIALTETSRWVVANYVDKFATYRVTMTAPILNRSRCVMFLVAAPDKAAPLAEVLEGPPEPARLPSQLIRPAGGELVWLVDHAAASRLRQ